MITKDRLQDLFHARSTVIDIINSGYVGVYIVKKTGMWASSITIRGVRVEFGSYKSKREALEARNCYIIMNNLTEYPIQKWKG